jgi:hypothetical protein
MVRADGGRSTPRVMAAAVAGLGRNRGGLFAHFSM